MEETKVIGDLYEDNGYGSAAGRIYDTKGVAPTLGAAHFSQIKYITEVLDTKTRCGKALTEQNRTEQSCLIRQATKDGLIRCDVPGIADLAYPSSKTRRGRVIDEGMTCPTLTTESIPNVLEPWTWEIDGEKYIIRIRKLTPKECWRLMDFADSDFEKAKNVNSNTQLYKQAGNSIVKNVLVAVFGQMLPGREDVYKNREPAADFMNLPVEEEE